MRKIIVNNKISKWAHNHPASSDYALGKCAKYQNVNLKEVKVKKLTG